MFVESLTGIEMRGFDWSRHPLGPPESWPTMLRVLVNNMLASPESHYLIWGKEEWFFSNDAYRPILGGRLSRSIGRTLADLWPDAYEAVRPALQRAFEGKSTRFTDFYIEMARNGVPEDTWWTFSYAPLRDETGRIVGVSCLTNEMTDRIGQERAIRDAEQRRQVLHQELAHRLKNTLAVVQSIATQTLRSAPDLPTARDSLTKRIQALSGAHDILLTGRQDGGALEAVIRGAVSLHDPDGRIALAGPELRIGPKAALALALIMHELSTNAAKYGALSVPPGRVEVAWAVTDGQDTDGALLTLNWRERNGPPALAPDRKGFGTRLIAMGLSGSEGSSAELDYTPDGLACRIVARLAHIQAEDD